MDLLRVDGLFFLFAALLVLVLPISWLMAAVSAAAIHELCHMAAVRLLGGSLSGFSLGIGSARIEGNLHKRGQAILAAAAGPMGSLLLLLLIHRMPKLALCGGIQGLYNLLPIYPLDGGRILRYLLEILCPGIAEKAGSAVELLVCFAWILFSVAGMFYLRLGILLVLAVWVPISGVLKEKFLAKRGKCEYNSATNDKEVIL